MREDDINLISGQQVTKKKMAQSLSELCIIIFAIVFIIGVAIIAYSFFLSSRQQSLTTQAGNLRTNLSSNTKKEKLLITNERLAAIRGVMVNRNGVESSAVSVVSAIPDNFTIESITADDKQITLSISGGNLADFAVLLSDTLPAFVEKNKANIIAVDVGSFEQENGSYTLNLIFNITGAIK